MEASKNVLILVSPLVKYAVDISWSPKNEIVTRKNSLLANMLALVAADSFVDLFTVSQ